MATIRSACPVVRQGVVEFWVWVPAGEGDGHRLPIERVVHWLQTSVATVRFVHGGKVLREETIATDSNGYLASVNTAVEYVKSGGLVEQFSITPSSTLILEVEAVVIERPVFSLVAAKAEDDRECFLGEEVQPRVWYCVPDEWLLLKADDGLDSYVPIQAVELGREVVWSSACSSDENAQCVESFMERWRVIEIG